VVELSCDQPFCQEDQEQNEEGNLTVIKNWVRVQTIHLSASCVFAGVCNLHS